MILVTNCHEQQPQMKITIRYTIWYWTIDVYEKTFHMNNLVWLKELRASLVPHLLIANQIQKRTRIFQQSWNCFKKNLVDLIRRLYYGWNVSPRLSELKQVEEQDWSSVPIRARLITTPGKVMVRFSWNKKWSVLTDYLKKNGKNKNRRILCIFSHLPSGQCIIIQRCFAMTKLRFFLYSPD